MNMVRSLVPLILTTVMAGCATQAISGVDAQQENVSRPSIPGQGASPVPAFVGGGKDWTINIRSTGQGNHDIELVREGTRMKGTLLYRGQPADAPSSLSVLLGEVKSGDKPHAIIVEIARQSCVNQRGLDTGASVHITLEGQPQLRGCGHLAVY